MVLNAANTEGFFYLVPFVVFIPLIGLLINIIIGGNLGERAIGAIACLASGLSFVVAVLLGVALIAQPEGLVVPYLNWITIGNLQLDWAFRVDTLSVTMMVLVSANNYMMLFVGWEGVGLCSYLLIGFWYEKGKDGIGNALAGKKAFITNRIGDFGFLIAAFLMFKYFQPLAANGVFSFEFDSVASIAPQVAPAIIVAITLFMLLGVTGKSAQLPLYVWLPDAMAGPTPVSAPLHAATMVTAGVYPGGSSYR